MRPLPLTFAALALLGAVALRSRLGRKPIGLLVALGALLAVYGSGVVELPSLEEAIEGVGTTLGGWTYLVVGGLAFLEAAAFVGLLAPGEFAVVFGGIIAGRGDIELVPLIAVVWFAAFAGDLTSYAFGRKVGRGWALRYGSGFGVTPNRLEWAEGYFASHGGKTIVLGRFVGIVRALAPFIAGTSRMRLRTFLLADIVGTGLWSVTFSVLGYLFWQSLDRALELARTGKLGLFGLLALVALGIAAYRLLGTKSRRRRTVEWLRRRPRGVEGPEPARGDSER